MKKMMLMGLLLVFGFNAQAETIVLKALCSAHEEYGDYDEDSEDGESSADHHEGWTVTEDEYGDKAYQFSATISTSQLPFQRNIGSLAVSVSKEAVLSVGMSVGDADASAEASFELPRNGTKLVPFQRMVVNSSGGDHASGVWGFNCVTEVSVR